MIELSNRIILDDGTVLNTVASGIEMLYEDRSIDHMIFWPEKDVELYNQSNQLLDLQWPQLTTSDTEVYQDEDWTNTWFTPEPWASMDLTQWIIEKCNNDTELERAATELILFEQHGLIPVLRHSIYMVHVFRLNQILWGVGRGSSVGSFLLYLSGINRINPLIYGLDVDEFLKISLDLI